MSNYSEVDANGYIVRASVCSNPNDYTPGTGNRLVRDIFPIAPKYKTARRVEPVPADAEEVEYVVDWSFNHEEMCQLIRNDRNLRMMKCDWVVLDDSHIKKNKPELYQQWLTYRQALRDINLQPGFPYEVEWPVEPEGNPPVLILGTVAI